MNKDNPNLDLLRSCAVSFVVLSHMRDFVGWGAEQEAVYRLEALGGLGVAIFFVHTTLVLLMSLERHGPAAGPFFIRRVFRIYPLAVAVVILSALLKWREGVLTDLGELASNLLLIQNITGHASTPRPLWTLPYELQMYLFLPALYVVTRLSQPRLRIALICGASLALAAVAWLTSIDLHLLRFVPCFLPGALAFVLAKRRDAQLSPIVLFGFIAVAAVVIPAIVAAGVPQAPAMMIMCLLLGLSIPLCRPVKSPPLVKCASVVATYSYGIYLTHPLAFWLAFGGLAQAPAFVQWGVWLLMLAGLPCAAYRAVEKPGITLGIWLSNKARRVSRPRAAA
ncbi:acyltransferase [Variovorax paradoxus]|nr:acyltransferase [Variovorax paradoxus]